MKSTMQKSEPARRQGDLVFVMGLTYETCYLLASQEDSHAVLMLQLTVSENLTGRMNSNRQR